MIPETTIDCDKIFIVTDTHFGARGNSIEWLDTMMDYFENDFIPSIKNKIGPKDILIHSGDVFDNRQSLNLQVLTRTVALFAKLSNIFKNGIYIIAGNHDVMKKYSNDISSLDSLQYIPGVHIYKEPVILNTPYKRVLMLPWRHSLDDEKKTILESKCQLIFCHTNFINCKFDRSRIIEEGLSADDIKNVERVYCGHIHWGQQNGKVNILGTPYQITRSDSDNVKGYWILDPKTMIEQHIENNYSPKFKRLFLKDLLELSIDQIRGMLENTRLDLMIPIGINWNLNKLIELLQNICHSVNITPVNDKISSNDETVNIENALDFRGFLLNMVEASISNNTIKSSIINKFDELYKKLS